MSTDSRAEHVHLAGMKGGGGGQGWSEEMASSMCMSGCAIEKKKTGVWLLFFKLFYDVVEEHCFSHQTVS